MIPSNVRALRITAAAGTELAGASSTGTVNVNTYWILTISSQLTELYDPKAFFTHAALLRQGFPHCAKFLTAASRRSLDRVPVPVWLIILSDQLTIVVLVGLYPTNKLMVRGLISKQQHKKRLPFIYNLNNHKLYPVLAILSNGYPNLEGRLSTCYSPVRHSTNSPKRAFSFDLHV